MGVSLTPEKLAEQLFVQIQTEVPAGSEIPSEKRHRVENELIYLSLFFVELGVYLVYRESPVRQRVMDSFWNLVRQAGLTSEAINTRFESYTEVIQTDLVAQAWPAVGQMFARNCLAPQHDGIARVGEAVAQQLFTKISASLKSAEVPE